MLYKCAFSDCVFFLHALILLHADAIVKYFMLSYPQCYNTRMATTQKPNGTTPRGTRKYVRVKDRRQGLEPAKRTQLSNKNANQWTITPKQIKFTELWLTPGSETFGNAYQSAVQAGFSVSTAIKISSNALGLEWVQAAKKRLITLEPSHTIKALEHMALHSKQDRDKIKALELVGKIQGLFVDRSISHIDVQFTNEVPRPVLDIQPQRPDVTEARTVDTTDE